MSTYDYPPELITGPTVEPFTAQDFLDNDEYFKSHSLPDDTQTLLDDTLIPTARRRMEKYLNRKLITQTWEIVLDTQPGVIDFPFGQLQSVSSVKTIAVDDTETTESSDNYHVKTGDGGKLWIKETSAWSTTSRAYDVMRIQFVCGYGDAATAIPQPILLGILNYIRFMYEYPEKGIPKEIQDQVREYWMPAV